MKTIVDTILGPVIDLLNNVISRLDTVSIVANRGINLDYYLGFFSFMGDGWVVLIKTVISCILILTTVFVARSVYNLYLSLKEGVKFW